MRRHAKASSSGSSTRQSSRLGLFVAAVALLGALILGVTAAGAIAPVVTPPSASEVQYSTAHLEGEVNPEGEATTFNFQYITEAQYLANIGAGEPPFTGASETATRSLAEDAGLTPVGANLTGLAAQTNYYFRLVATNDSGSNFASSGAPFETKGPVTPPVVTGVEAAAVEYTIATVEGEVELASPDPAFNATTCRFEYVTQGEWEGNGNAFPEPAGAPSVGCNTEPTGFEGATAVEAHLSSLTPETTYHLRLVAGNQAAGEPTRVEAGAGGTFKTKGPVPKPTVTIDPPSLIAAVDGSFAFTGHVNPGGTDPAFETQWSFTCEPSCGSPQGGTISADGSNHLVEAEVTGLEAKTTYTVTLHATNAGGEQTAEATFKTPAGPPAVETTVSYVHQDHSFTLSGLVNPRGSQITDCHFAYGLDEHYGQSIPCLGVDESQRLGFGLFVTSGQFRLGFKSEVTPDLPFSASASQIQDALVALPSIGSGNVSVKALHEGGVAYEIKFVGDLGQQNLPLIEILPGSPPLDGFAGVGLITDGATAFEHLGPGGSPVEVHAVLPSSRVTPGATYHFRLEASSVGGSAHSEDGSFEVLQAPAGEACPNEQVRVEQHSTFLPDCRAYEQVSPVDKNGSNVVAWSLRTQASTDGEAFLYSSLVGFGDAHGSGVAFDYLAHRGASGWSTHGITPTVGSLTAEVRGGVVDSYYPELSSDLSRGIFDAVKPLAGTPESVTGVANLYLRDDLGTPGAGSYRLMTACPLCEESNPEAKLEPLSTVPAILQAYVPRIAGSSPDLGHVAFESIENLTANAPAQTPFCGSSNLPPFPPPSPASCAPRLYEYGEGQTRLAGILPDGTPADFSVAGEGAKELFYTPHVVSDGSDGHTRIEFTQPTTTDGKTYSELDPIGQIVLDLPGVDGSRGNLYQRIDGSETIQLNESERTGGESSPFSPARYLDASTNGERVFFMTGQALTDDATPGQPQIYVYDTAAGPKHLTLVGGSAFRFIGASDDGHYAYYMDEALRIVMWHDGTVRQLGDGPDKAGLLIDADTLWGQTFHEARVTPDGRHLLMVADRPPVPGVYDHGNCLEGGCRELYLYSVDSDTWQCASCDPGGAVPQSDATIGSGAQAGDTTLGGSLGTPRLNRALSADGRYVFFNTADPLLPEDTNGTVDAYEYDTGTGDVSLLSSGTSEQPSFFLEADPEGENVFIGTAQPLVGYDTDGAYDVYDVRTGGGFPEPRPQPAPCAGDNCQGSQAAPPAPAPVGSGLEGPGNRKPPRCPKGKHSVKSHGKTRCVANKHREKKHHKGHGRAARADRGGAK